MTRPISTSQLRTYRRQLDRMMLEFEAHYPGLAANMGEQSNPRSETIRNVGTAAAQVRCWIASKSNGGDGAA